MLYKRIATGGGRVGRPPPPNAGKGATPLLNFQEACQFCQDMEHVAS